MSQHFEVHPDNPQPRCSNRPRRSCIGGGVVAIPTDSGYALVCHLDDKAAAEALHAHPRRRRQAPPDAAVPRLSELASYARRQPPVPAAQAGHAGALHLHPRATKEVPRRLSHPSRRTIGLRVPDHAVTQALLEQMGHR